MNKRAQEDWLTGIPSLILIFLVLVIFAIFFIGCTGLGQKEQKIGGIPTKESALVLLNYLRTPVKDVTIADMIIKKENGISDESLITETKNIFNKIYGECYVVYINDAPLVGSDVRFTEALVGAKTEEISIILPAEKPINVTLKPYYLTLLRNALDETKIKEQCKVE